MGTSTRLEYRSAASLKWMEKNRIALMNIKKKPNEMLEYLLLFLTLYTATYTTIGLRSNQ